LVFDADASQQAAISRALAGTHVLIDGPPGTGKSQTIANIIAGMAAQGRRVLFVAGEAGGDRGGDRTTKPRPILPISYLTSMTSGSTGGASPSSSPRASDRAGSEPPTDVDQLHRHLTQLRSELIRHPARVAPRPASVAAQLLPGAMRDPGLPAEYASAVRLPDTILRILISRKSLMSSPT